jgi:cytochrome c peroxidase
MRNLWLFTLLFFAAAFILNSCTKDKQIVFEENIMQIPKGFPSINYPLGNEYTKERWELGKKLFYDNKLSKSNTVNCGSCHKPNLAFSDDMAFSLGNNNEIGTSNAPTLVNIAYHPYFTRAGGVPSLEMQVLVPIQEHNEFNTNILDLAALLNADKEYNEAAINAYHREFDPYVLVRAIANFERSFISGNSPFDKYFYQNDKSALSESEIKGMNLFMGNKTNCSSCHTGFNFTNNLFENNGLYENYRDSGRMRLTKLETDRGLFKVPTLRNVAITSPYMHDGSILTLEQVIENYDKGGKAFINKSDILKPLNLTIYEKQDLINFLKSLTDKQFINNNIFKK